MINQMDPNQIIKNLKTQGFILKKSTDFEGGIERLTQDLSELFSKYFSPQYVNLNFEIPAEYRAFLECAGGSFSLDNYYHLFNMNSLLSVTNFFIEEWEPNDSNAIWIHIGGYSDKRGYLMCCDKSKAEFGKISEYWDDHPWMDGERIFLERHETDWNSIAEYSMSE